MKLITFTATAVVLSVWTGLASADVLVDSGDPGGYDPNRVNKAVYYQPGTGEGQFVAQAFTLPAGALITGIDSYLFFGPGTSIDVQLVTEIGPGATAADQLARFTLTTPTFIEAQYVASPPLAVLAPAGTYYVVYGTPGGNSGFPGYAPNDIGDLTFANTLNGSTSSVNPAFPAASGFFTDTDEGDLGLRVHGILPEPTAGAVLLLAGTASLLSRRR